MTILAISSSGGHWIQLLRLTPAFEGHEIIYACTKSDYQNTLTGSKFYFIPDANRKSINDLVKMSFSVLKLVLKVRPSFIITTGAAPGLLAIILGRIFGSKTIWIDSIANVETVSLSGKIASKFANRTYTQWPELASGKFIFKGNVLS